MKSQLSKSWWLNNYYRSILLNFKRILLLQVNHVILKINKTSIISIFSIILVFGLTKSVNAQQSVSFNSPVNTKTKPIELQTKKTFELEKAGVFASNEFDGARLSDFTLENDSTAIVIINAPCVPNTLKEIKLNNFAGSTWLNSVP